MKTTEVKLIFPEFDTLAEYVRLEAINLDIGYKGEKGEKGDKGDPGQDADIEGANLAIQKVNNALEDLEELKLGTTLTIDDFITNKESEIQSILDQQRLQILDNEQLIEEAVINANKATNEANSATAAAIEETSKIAPKLEDLSNTLTKALGAVNAVNKVADDLEDEILKVLNINITNDGTIVTITDREGNPSEINVKGDSYVITEDDYDKIAELTLDKVDLNSILPNLKHYVEDGVGNTTSIYNTDYSLLQDNGIDNSNIIIELDEVSLNIIEYKTVENNDLESTQISLKLDSEGAYIQKYYKKSPFSTLSKSRIITYTDLRPLGGKSLTGSGDIIDDLYLYTFIIGNRLFVDDRYFSISEDKKILYLDDPDIAAIEDNKLIIKL